MILHMESEIEKDVKRRKLIDLKRKINICMDQDRAAGYVKRVNDMERLSSLRTHLGFAQTCEGKILDMESFLIPINRNNGNVYKSLDTNT